MPRCHPQQQPYAPARLAPALVLAQLLLTPMKWLADHPASAMPTVPVAWCYLQLVPALVLLVPMQMLGPRPTLAAAPPVRYPAIKTQFGSYVKRAQRR